MICNFSGFFLSCLQVCSSVSTRFCKVPFYWAGNSRNLHTPPFYWSGKNKIQPYSHGFIESFHLTGGEIKRCIDHLKHSEFSPVGNPSNSHYRNNAWRNKMKPQSIFLQKFSFNRILTVILIAVMLLAAAPIVSVSADSVGYYSPTKATSNGPGWTNPIYATASDNLYATARKNNRQLKLSSFNIPAIPGGAVINGIEVTVEGFTTGTQAAVALSAGSSFTTSKSTSFTSTESTLTLGGPTDAWGKTWSATDFQNKFTVKLTAAATLGLLSVDHVQVKVYYTPPNTTLVLESVFGDYGS